MQNTLKKTYLPFLFLTLYIFFTSCSKQHSQEILSEVGEITQQAMGEDLKQKLTKQIDKCDAAGCQALVDLVKQNKSALEASDYQALIAHAKGFLAETTDGQETENQKADQPNKKTIKEKIIAFFTVMEKAPQGEVPEINLTVYVQPTSLGTDENGDTGTQKTTIQIEPNTPQVRNHPPKTWKQWAYDHRGKLIFGAAAIIFSAYHFGVLTFDVAHGVEQTGLQEQMLEQLKLQTNLLIDLNSSRDGL